MADCLSLFSFRMPKASLLSIRFDAASIVLSSLLYLPHSSFIWFMFFWYTVFAFSYQLRQALIIVSSCLDLSICKESLCFCLRLLVVLYTSLDFDCLAKKPSDCAALPISLADCTLFLMELFTLDLLSSSSSSTSPFTCYFSGFGSVFCVLVLTKLRYFNTSTSFSSFYLFLRCLPTLARTDVILSLVGAKFSSMLMIMSPISSSISISNPSSA